MKNLTLLILLLLAQTTLCAQVAKQEIALYTEEAVPNAINVPDAERMYKNNVLVIEKISRPTLTIYLPEADKATGAAVVICPGGGYAVIAIEHEGHDIAQRFVEKGIAAFVLKYRLPDNATTTNPSIAPLQDAQQAIATLRRNAVKWNINPNKVGIMGFSAGGHLASTAGTHFDKNYINAKNSDNVRPDFMMLIYPVISTDKTITHSGSVKNLLGATATEKELHSFSNEKNVTPATPQTFLVHVADDSVVPVQNSMYFAEALVKNNVPVEMHIFPKGGHGFGLNNLTTQTQWFDLCINWMRSQGLIK